MTDELILVGDVGGTHSRWALFDGELKEITVAKTCASTGLQQAVEPWLGRFIAVGVAVAGPVIQGTVSLTNANWRASEHDLNVPVCLVNDLAAVALSVPVLADGDIEWWGGKPTIGGRVLCIGVGTGFGGALWTGDGVVAMEPGHEDLGAGFGGLTVEEVVSGMALEDHDDADQFSAGLLAAVTRLGERLRPDTILFIGGVVEHRPELFEPLRGLPQSLGRIVHPYPALLGVARAAKASLGMTVG